VTSTVDYSYTYVGADQIAAGGYIGAERYLGYDGRCLTAGERDELLAQGLGIGLIWETAADRSLDGYWAGWNDAEAANAYADGLGAPVVSIWYATDFHASQAQIEGPIHEYYTGVRDSGGRQPRVYGGAPVIDHCVTHIAGYGPGWQAAAASWSNYQLSPNACLLQEVQQIWGGAADTNVPRPTWPRTRPRVSRSRYAFTTVVRLTLSAWASSRSAGRRKSRASDPVVMPRSMACAI